MSSSFWVRRPGLITALIISWFSLGINTCAVLLSSIVIINGHGSFFQFFLLGISASWCWLMLVYIESYKKQLSAFKS